MPAPQNTTPGRTANLTADRTCPWFFRDSRSAGRILALLVAFSLVASCGTRNSESIELLGQTMGTGYALRAENNGLNRDALTALAESVEEELAAIDLEMSTWRDDSVIARLNVSAESTGFPLPDRFFEVLSHALAINQATDGALDVTLLPLARAWGFQGDQPPSRPEDATLDALLNHTGMVLLDINPATRSIRKLDGEVQLDVSSLAKGYAADRLAGLLWEAGLRNFLVEIGGELVARGNRPDGRPWRIALDRPGEATAVMEVTDRAVASSGDYRIYFEEGGNRYAHVLDPSTGAPPLNNVAAVTVVADDGITADALATAFMVLEPNRSLALADAMNAEVSLLIRDGDNRYQQLNTPGFPVLAAGTRAANSPD